MTDSCKLSIRAQISRAKFRQILRLFALDLTASQIAEISNLNRNTVNRYLTLTRSLIADFCERESPFSGKVECDESYFGSRHKRGKPRSRSWKQTHRFRNLQTQRTRPYGDRQKRQSQDFASNYQGQSRTWLDTLHWRLSCLQLDCAPRLSEALPDLSPGQLCSRWCPH